jgi:hypothetical protein
MSGPDAAAFEGYFLYKAFDLISDGAYKKLVVRNKEAGDPDATALYAKVQSVTSQIKAVQNQVNALHEYGKQRLQTVCQEVVAHSAPPCNLRTCWNTCSISGTRSRECLDLTRVGKSPVVVMVHRKFAHFALMLWVVTKFEHLCKVYTRHWLSALEAGPLAQTAVQRLCRDFEQHARAGGDIAALHSTLQHALTHVQSSLEDYRRVPCYESYA